jgi:hypothetical protein
VKNPFGTDPVIAFFQGTWNDAGTSFTVTSQVNCVVQGPQPAGVAPGVPNFTLVVELLELPRNVPGATLPNTTGVNDTSILPQFCFQGLVGGIQVWEVGVVYGPVMPPTVPMLFANQIQITLTTEEEAPLGSRMNGTIYNCADGSFTPESP